jgi:hypothetical protein
MCRKAVSRKAALTQSKKKHGEIMKPAEKTEAKKDMDKEAAKKAHLAKLREKIKAKKK